MEIACTEMVRPRGEQSSRDLVGELAGGDVILAETNEKARASISAKLVPCLLRLGLQDPALPVAGHQAGQDRVHPVARLAELDRQGTW